jgi:hypothetical protein
MARPSDRFSNSDDDQAATSVGGGYKDADDDTEDCVTYLVINFLETNKCLFLHTNFTATYFSETYRQETAAETDSHLSKRTCTTLKSRCGPGSNPCLLMWDLWWTKWRWSRFSPSTSVSPANFHSTSFSTITITDHLGLVQ